MLEKKELDLIAQVVTDVNKPIMERLDRAEEKMNNLEEKVVELQMTLENETNRNISIIAEGHLDLSRKLDEALKAENEKEMLLIRAKPDGERIKEDKGQDWRDCLTP